MILQFDLCMMGGIGMQLYGFAYSGPFGHFLHKLMDIIFRGKKDNQTVAKKVNPLSLRFESLDMYKFNGPLMGVSDICVHEQNFVSIDFEKDILIELLQVLLEQLSSSPWNNLLFMMYYGLVVEGIQFVTIHALFSLDSDLFHYYGLLHAG